MQAKAPLFGEKHRVDLQIAERSSLTRANVRRLLLAGTIERGGA
jgi:hypothetical protein